MSWLDFLKWILALPGNDPAQDHEWRGRGTCSSSHVMSQSCWHCLGSRLKKQVYYEGLTNIGHWAWELVLVRAQWFGDCQPMARPLLSTTKRSYDCMIVIISTFQIFPSWEFWQVHQTPPFRRNLQTICACSPVGSSHASICPVWQRVIGQNWPQTTALSTSSTTPNGFCDILCARYPGPRQQTSVHLHKRLQGQVTPKTCKALWGPWNSTFLPIFFTLHILFLWPFAQALRDSWFGGRADVSKSMPLSTSYFKCTGALVYAIPFIPF